MERRFAATQHSGTTGASSSHHSSNSHLVRGTNSFIPTSSSHHGHGHGHGHHGKSHHSSHHNNNHLNNNLISNNSVSSMQSHVQQIQQSHSNGLHNNYYQNMPANHTGTLGSRLDHHNQHQQQLLHHQQQQHQQQQQQQQQQQLHQRTLTKSYSSHYSNTAANTNNSSANHNTYYGNANPSTIVMNGGGGGGGGGGSGNGHHVVTIQPVVHQIQHSYNQMHHQQMQQHHQQSQLHLQHQQQQSTNNNNHYYQPSETEGLPQSLVESMRTLFDILDDTKQGKIRLSDIESRWESDSNGTNGKNSGAEPLIKMGVMGYLRKVTPQDGMLTFDRFCAGLRLALITNNNIPSAQNQNPLPPVTIGGQQQGNLHQTQAQYSQQTFQQQVKNMTNNMHSANNNVIIINGTASSSNSNTNTNSKSNTLSNSNPSVPIPVQVQSNTIHRMSKIPSLSSSRLPMPNGGSGIPVSPNSRLSGAFSSSNSNGNNNGTGIPLPNTNSNPVNNPKRHSTNPEPGITVALVHHPPNPNPKPTGTGGIPPPSYSSTGGTLKMTKQSSTPGLHNRYGTKNGSLDNLKTPNEEKLGLPTKDRPPSAPLLDIDIENDTENPNGYYTHNSRRNRERARSHDRDREEQYQDSKGRSESSEDGSGKRVNFVTPRQRTLSMPQLQLNKLKPKSSGIHLDDSPPEKLPQPSSNSHSNSSTNTLKSHSNSNKILGGSSLGSSIPSITSSKQKVDHSPTNLTPPLGNKELTLVNGHAEREKEQPPPPPKPPRNVNAPPGGMGPVTISTNLTSTTLPDPPLSGSSSGSANNSKPEIRNVLHTWQKGMSDKKPVEATLSTTSVTTTSSINTTSTNATAPAALNIPTGNEVKLRGNSKTNLRRRETPRRHTVQSGIDFSTLKRLKQLEQERDVLQQGTSYLEKAKDWYIKQLESADEKIELLSKGAPTSDYWSESHEERLNLLGCRISEVNSLLTALMDGSSRLPLHMNLQIPSHLSLRTITRLKEQNRQLTQEVSDCSHRVTQLETEKAMLLRQLFHQKNNSHPDETVYM